MYYIQDIDECNSSLDNNLVGWGELQSRSTDWPCVVGSPTFADIL